MPIIEIEQIINRLKNIPPWIISAVNDQTDAIEPIYTISSDIVDSLIIKETDLEQQINIISAQILNCGRLESIARRTLVASTRKYRQWRSSKILSYITPKLEDKAWKKPTEAVIEALYRSESDYLVYQTQMEKVEESFNATHMVLEGFKAKLEMLKLATKLRYDLSMARQ